jgi:hypothetical protein
MVWYIVMRRDNFAFLMIPFLFISFHFYPLSFLIPISAVRLLWVAEVVNNNNNKFREIRYENHATAGQYILIH